MMLSKSQLSEHADAIWGLLWEYIAKDGMEDYSEEMAERLCEIVLPEVWNKVLLLDSEIKRRREK